MKIKIIDLFNKKANGEKIPQKIKYQGDIYELDYENCYKNTEGYFTDSIYYDLSNLNDEVEIIEDEEEIGLECLDPYDTYFKDGTDLVYKLMYDKINELIMKVNNLDKRTKEGN